MEMRVSGKEDSSCINAAWMRDW